MTIWLDAQLPPALAPWLDQRFGVRSVAVRDLGLRHALDDEIWDRAAAAGTVVMTKDKDFVERVTRLGPPPQVLWITLGNTSNARLRDVLADTFPAARKLLDAGEPLVEIGDRG